MKRILLLVVSVIAGGEGFYLLLQSYQVFRLEGVQELINSESGTVGLAILLLTVSFVLIKLNSRTTKK